MYLLSLYIVVQSVAWLSYMFLSENKSKLKSIDDSEDESKPLSLLLSRNSSILVQ